MQWLLADAPDEDGAVWPLQLIHSEGSWHLRVERCSDGHFAIEAGDGWRDRIQPTDRPPRNESLKGQIISTGSLIGKEGKTGYACGSTGVHTHVEVHEGRININMALGQAPGSSTKLDLPSVLGNVPW